MEAILLIEDCIVNEEHGDLVEVFDFNGDCDGVAQTFSFEVDVLLAVSPQQVWSYDGESSGKYDSGKNKNI